LKTTHPKEKYDVVLIGSSLSGFTSSDLFIRGGLSYFRNFSELLKQQTLLRKWSLIFSVCFA
jgi:hypothetical protein|tara:strand:- start:96 stop:281 length:186 start_codon:yes stop_codon:yes gene_type:complete